MPMPHSSITADLQELSSVTHYHSKIGTDTASNLFSVVCVTPYVSLYSLLAIKSMDNIN
jgi:hypothetical protein